MRAAQRHAQLRSACTGHGARGPCAPPRHAENLSQLPACGTSSPECSYDQFNVRLRLAVFDSGIATRYRLVSLAPIATGGEGQQRPGSPPGGVYRGPTVQLLQPGGIGGPGKPWPLAACMLLAACLPGWGLYLEVR